MKRAWVLAAFGAMVSHAACGGRISEGECEKGSACDNGQSAPSADGERAAAGHYARPAPLAAEAPIEGELASGLTSPGPIAVDQANVYFGANGKLLLCRKSGCAGKPIELADVGDRGVTAIVSDGAEVFWADGDIRACPSAGCVGAPRLVAKADGASAIVIANDMLYWTTFMGAVQRCAKDCTTPETLTTDGTNGMVMGIAVTDTDVYWTTEGNFDSATGINGMVRTCSLAGPCTPRTLIDRQNTARTIVVRKNVLAWTADGESTARWCTLPACSDVGSSFHAAQQGLAMDESHVYWSFGSGGWIEFAGILGEGGTGQLVEGEKPTFLATDATNLYWIDTDIPDSRGGIAGTGAVRTRQLVH